MARDLVFSCDVCGKPDAEEWILMTDDKKWRVDLCKEEHGKLLREIADKGSSDPPMAAVSSHVAKRYASMVRGVPAPKDRPEG